MNTRRNVTRRVEQAITNVGVPPSGDQVPPIEEDVNDDQAPANPPPLTNENIWAALLQMAQAMMSQSNPEVLPMENEQVATMAYHLRDL
ncbi:hypothetical protein EJD97_020673 [Solanum chilense]|uniref:Uncharacterized protein n=1 Tax=Solanum chilense TaxID=4083 RepID=A0A6N2AGA7_SOLCI|nr:hypothetical protein EJD97_020673 [Solanum chilense]